jgi:predicted transcriptional regulator
MKSVLISIQPKWCELIASGKKTVEVRKTIPKIEKPFKCYIYCTQTKTIGDFILCKSKENVELFGLNAAKGINKGFA